ncbi:MAG: hypothetical protein Q7S82_00190 [bacterium]|nr:hypothetical protein [bacterium]
MKKIKHFFQTLPRILAEKPFLTFLVILLFFLILSGSIFYKYSILADKAKPEIPGKSLIFDEKTYNDILQIWQERKEKFEAADKKEYPNLFWR